MSREWCAPRLGSIVLLIPLVTLVGACNTGSDEDEEPPPPSFHVVTSGGGNDQIRTRYSTNGTEWSSSVVLEDLTATPVRPDIAVDPANSLLRYMALRTTRTDGNRALVIKIGVGPAWSADHYDVITGQVGDDPFLEHPQPQIRFFANGTYGIAWWELGVSLHTALFDSKESTDNIYLAPPLEIGEDGGGRLSLTYHNEQVYVVWSKTIEGQDEGNQSLMMARANVNGTNLNFATPVEVGVIHRGTSNIISDDGVLKIAVARGSQSLEGSVELLTSEVGNSWETAATCPQSSALGLGPPLLFEDDGGHRTLISTSSDGNFHRLLAFSDCTSEEFFVPFFTRGIEYAPNGT